MREIDHPFDPKIKHHCGIYGVYQCEHASQLTFTGLYALQHRGQESAGIVSFNGHSHFIHRGMGLVNEIFNESMLSRLEGDIAIGHNRYSTTGSPRLINAQPLLINYKDGQLAIAHNGNLVNSQALRAELEERGSIFQSTMDTEVIVHLIATSREKTLLDRIIDALSRVEGAYSLLILSGDELFAIKDPHGWRPLSIARLNDGHIVSSETCGFDIIGAEYIREVEPGEIIHFTPRGFESHQPFPKDRRAHCVFEFVYFSRPDSVIFGKSADLARRRYGRQLAIEHPVEADRVISVPDSSNSAAIGFAQESGIPLDIGLIRNHYIGRTFIHPFQQVRDLSVKIKFNPVKGVLKNKRVVLVDDSIVRGTTSKKLVSLLRAAGATEVHLRIASPPIRFPCFYGIDMPTRKELVASRMSIEETKEYLNVDSLGYLSLEGMLACTPLPDEDLCHACFSGNYPIKNEEEYDKLVLEKGHNSDVSEELYEKQ
jgi:amidophosphoribosyltransferase